MLPLHGQSTAAVKIYSPSRSDSLCEKTRSHVFDKQAELSFAEFLLTIYNLYILLSLYFYRSKKHNLINTHFSMYLAFLS